MNRLGPRPYDLLLEQLQQDPEGLKKLTPEQEKILLRLNYAYSNMMLHKSPQKVSAMIQKQFEVSRSTSYQYIDYAFKIYGKSNIIDDTGELIWYEDSLTLYKKCMEEMEFGPAARALESRRKFLDTRSTRQRDFDPSKFNVVTINITCRPEDIGLKSFSDEEVDELRKLVYRKKKVVELTENGNGTFQ